MLLDIHKLSLSYIIEFWKDNDGKLLTCYEHNDDYKSIKKKLHDKGYKFDDEYLFTAISYLTQTGLLQKGQVHPSGGLAKVSPTPKGLDINKNWFLREDNFKLLLNGFIGLFGVILGFILSHLAQ
jgi:hypothetical protein